MSANVSTGPVTSGAKGGPLGSIRELIERRWLVWYFIQRQLTQSYRGSFLGFLWLIVGPLLMVGLYTLVFSEALGLRFRETDSAPNYGLYLYCGLLPYLALSGTLNRGAAIIRSNSTLVQRVPFPLSALPLAMATTAVLTQLLGFAALLILLLLFGAQLHWTLVLLPLITIPHLFLVMGGGYLSAIIGAYVPDLKESMSSLTRVLFFATPIIWPASRVPERLSFLVDFNPLAYIVEAYRNVVLDGKVPGLMGLMWFSLFSLALLVVGFCLFDRVKGRFADII